MYLIKADYKTHISVDLLDKIIQEGAANGDDVLADICKTAVDTIDSLAGVLYDLSGEWVKADADRNFLIRKWALVIAVYWLYHRIDDEEVPAKVIKDYEDTMEALEKVSLGKYPLKLPPKVDEGGAGGSGSDEGPVIDGQGLRRIGSRKPRSHSM